MGAGGGRAQGSGLCLDSVGVYRLSLALVFSLGEVNRGVLVGMLQAFPCRDVTGLSKGAGD